MGSEPFEPQTVSAVAMMMSPRCFVLIFMENDTFINATTNLHTYFNTTSIFAGFFIKNCRFMPLNGIFSVILWQNFKAYIYIT